MPNIDKMSKSSTTEGMQMIRHLVSQSLDGTSLFLTFNILMMLLWDIYFHSCWFLFPFLNVHFFFFLAYFDLSCVWIYLLLYGNPFTYIGSKVVFVRPESYQGGYDHQGQEDPEGNWVEPANINAWNLALPFTSRETMGKFVLPVCALVSSFVKCSLPMW